MLITCHSERSASLWPPHLDLRPIPATPVKMSRARRRTLNLRTKPAMPHGGNKAVWFTQRYRIHKLHCGRLIGNLRTVAFLGRNVLFLLGLRGVSLWFMGDLYLTWTFNMQNFRINEIVWSLYLLSSSQHWLNISMYLYSSILSGTFISHQKRWSYTCWTINDKIHTVWLRRLMVSSKRTRFAVVAVFIVLLSKSHEFQVW